MTEEKSKVYCWGSARGSWMRSIYREGLGIGQGELDEEYIQREPGEVDKDYEICSHKRPKVKCEGDVDEDLECSISSTSPGVLYEDIAKNLISEIWTMQNFINHHLETEDP